MHKDPSVAATVFWNIAKDISQYGDVSVTRTSLEKAKFCLDAMNDDPGLRGTKGSPAFWSPRSLLKTSLDCDMALARLEADTDIAESSERYKTGLCQFLGIERSKLDYVSAKNRNPQILEKMAAQIVLDIPRKFSKEEDVEQAFAAMKEVASALVAFSGGKASSVLATQGLAVYFVAYCFALSRDRCGDAFDCLKDIIRVYRFFSIPHMASECAALVIRQHASELGSRALVARSIVDSILASDLIRARELLGAYNARSAEPWSVYLNKLVEKLIGADVPWLSELAFAEWQQIAASQGAPSDPSIVDVVLPALEKHILAPYILYEPSLDTLNGNVD
ncbi:hypothetical protein LPJ56_001359 [Coemansia sp. RSA 2599]|nr:hypothetical protein LPJ56_001359 [Coemansia sp. RSA 2599]